MRMVQATTQVRLRCVQHYLCFMEAQQKQDAKQKRYDAAYMRMAREWATLSHWSESKWGR